MRAVPSQTVVGKCHVHGFIKIACSTNTDVKSFNLTRITQTFQERFNSSCLSFCTKIRAFRSNHNIPERSRGGRLDEKK